MPKPCLIPSFAPIRARITAALAPEDRTHDTVTEICLLLAAIAHGKEEAWLQHRTPVLGVREAWQWLEDAREVFAEDIAAVRQVSQELEAYLLASGCSAPAAVAGVNLKLDLEFFGLPRLARRRLLGW
jgi:hypothetical protein